MSLQRIFESARKLGVPVVITDPGGRDPLVVLPLEQFEALNDSGQVDAMMTPKASPSNPVNPMKEKARVESLLADRAAELAQQRVDEVVAGVKAGSAVGGANAEISLEERFYLEPVEDGAGV